MKKLPGLLLVMALLVCFIPGCSATSSQPTAQSFIQTDQPLNQNATAAAHKTIALVMKTLTNPFFQEMEKGARQAAGELPVDLVVKTAAQETSIEQQIAIVEDLIDAKVDAIVIAPGDSRELIPALKKAQDAGIVVVNIDNRLDPDLSAKQGLVNVPFISVNNEQGAYLSAKAASDRVTIPTKAVILEGIRGAQNAEDRKNGALRAFKENSMINLVGSETAEWKIDEAHDVVKKMFDTNPDIKLVFCANDMMALGVLQYLNESGKSDVLVTGFDNLQEVKQPILDGKMVATIDQQAAKQGYAGVASAYKLINKQKVDLLTLVDVILVTKDNFK